jgi:predicted metal-dependent hydrolase
MLDWLRRAPSGLPLLTVCGRQLPVIIRRLPQSRRMTLRLAPDGSEVRLSIPRWGRAEEALAFARSRTAWLEAQLAHLPARYAITPGAHIPFRGDPFLLHHAPTLPRRPRLAEGTLALGGPVEGLESRLRRWLQAEARALFAADLAHYTALAQRPLPTLALSGARARWGSCSTSGIVRINWRLVMAPDFVRRSVVAHEVAHLVHFNHSPGFHALLAELYEHDIAPANLWLKQHGRTLYAHFG